MCDRQFTERSSSVNSDRHNYQPTNIYVTNIDVEENSDALKPPEPLRKPRFRQNLKTPQEEGEHMRTAMASTAKRDQEFSSTRQTTKTTLTPVYGRHDLQTPKKGTYCSFSSSERHDTAEQGKARSTQRSSRNTQQCQQNQQTAPLGAYDCHTSLR